MKKSIFLCGIFSFFLLALYFTDASGVQDEFTAGWKAGVARTVITPSEAMWMSGYISRDRPSEGKIHDLWAKALVLEDARGELAVMISADVRGIPKNVSDLVREKLKERFNLSRAQIMLNSSHTHSGPVLYDAHANDVYIYPREPQEREKIKGYSLKLVNDLVALVGKALDSREPAQIFTGHGIARFAVNRRNNDETTIEQNHHLGGPIDHTVPVLKVVKESGALVAIAFGYACHPTVLSGYQWSGDYPGFAQLELENRHPGVTALFFQGAGGDQNPMPRRSVPLAQQYGKELASAVDRVLKEEMRQVRPMLKTVYAEVELPLNPPPTKSELTKIAKESSGYQKRWAIKQLEAINGGDSFLTSYPYPVQVWALGDQTVISLGGEVVVSYAIALKQIFGPDVFVFGYSNDVMSYIPTAAIIKEGGYEGASSQMVRGMPSTWKPTIETIILQEVARLAHQTRIIIKN